jgi:hypothetical protein
LVQNLHTNKKDLETLLSLKQLYQSLALLTVMKKNLSFTIFLLAIISSNVFNIFAQNTALPFDKFVQLFPVETKPLPFAVGKVWLNKKPKQAALDNATITKYIKDAKIWGTNLLKTTLPSNPTFYPVARVNIHSNFYTLLVATSQEESADVYLLTYTKEGKFIDGVCAIVARPVTEGYSRSTIIDGGMVLMVKESKQGKPQLFTFDLWDIGTLHGKR